MSVEQFLRQKPDGNEHNEARVFIHNVWWRLNHAQLEEKFPTAQKAFKTCRDVGDVEALQALLRGTLGHADRLGKKLAELHPELVLEDEKEAQWIKKVSDKIAKLGEEIEEYLKTHADAK
jgi:hypothetical protein